MGSDARRAVRETARRGISVTGTFNLMCLPIPQPQARGPSAAPGRGSRFVTLATASTVATGVRLPVPSAQSAAGCDLDARADKPVFTGPVDVIEDRLGRDADRD